MTSTRTGQVLIVCTANICRSAFAEAWLRHRLRELGVSGVEVVSAGTDARDGQPAARETAQVLAERGLDAADLRSTRLTPQHLDAADLVLTATRSHRAVAARLRPTALPRLLTVRQAARLLEHAAEVAPGDRPRTVADLATVVRGVRGRLPSAGADDDVSDPWGEPLEAHRSCGDLLVQALEPLALGLAGGAGAG